MDDAQLDRKDENAAANDNPVESLAGLPPEALTAPTATVSSSLGLNAVLVTAAGAGALFLLAGTLTPCVGATRSAKLEWEKRQAQIEQAAGDASTNTPNAE